MIRSAITLSLCPEAKSGPFVLSDGLAEGCRTARELGFDAVELFPPSADELEVEVVKPLLEEHNLKVAAVGSGAGWLRNQYTLTNFDRAKREQGAEFIRKMIDAAGALGAPVIIGSMQGRWGNGVEREEAFYYLGSALTGLSNYAFEKYGVPVIYEPLNRYETNMCTTVAQGVEFITSQSLKHVVLLADLFHMNIEEADMPGALVAGGAHIGHVHFADSNRRSIGSGHTAIPPIAAALRQISYAGYVSAECFPYPDPHTAAKTTIDAFERFFDSRSHRMLNHRLIHPTILDVLGRAGHHARILIADGNYPVSSKKGPNAELVHLNLMPGLVSCTQVLQAVVSAISIDTVNTMGYETTGPYALTEDPPVWNEYRQALRDAKLNVVLEPIDKWKFYEAVMTPDHVLTIQTGDRQRFANLLLSVGVRMD